MEARRTSTKCERYGLVCKLHLCVSPDKRQGWYLQGQALSCCTPCRQPQAKEFSQSLIGAGGKHGKANIVEITYGKTEEEISQGDEDYAACKYLCMRTNVRRYTLYRMFS